jgi:hypothetical protein
MKISRNALNALAWNAGVVMLCLMASGRVDAGPLGDFEKVATQQSDQQARDRHDATNDDDDNWPFVVLDMIGEVVSYGGRLSLARVQGDSDFSQLTPREIGSPDLPFFRFDFGYQDLESGVEAFAGRVEAGYGPVGLQYHLTHLRQGSTHEHLDLSYIHGLYRVSPSDAFEFGIGLGQVLLEGEARNSGASVTLPINIYPLREFSIRLVPTWSDINGNSIRDYDGSVAYVQKYFSVRVGYREVRSHQELLRGPYAGVSFHY